MINFIVNHHRYPKELSLFIESGKTKSRTILGPVFSLLGLREDTPPKKIRFRDLTVPLDGIQITESDGNRWPLPKGEALEDHGSEFYTRKTEVLPPKLAYRYLRFIGITVPTVFQNYYLSGSFLVANAWGSNGLTFAGNTSRRDLLAPPFADLSSTRAALNVKGSIAIAACSPTNQVAQAARSVGELLKDVPALPGLALIKSRLRAVEVVAASASEFLNTIFAVAPTVDDILSFYKAVNKIDKLVDQYERDAGKVVRRSFHFPKEMSDETTEVTGDSPIGCDRAYGQNPMYPEPALALPVYKTMRRRVIEREIWFSGAFTYYLPPGYDTEDKKDRMKLTADLLGGKPTLETLWQLAPWSWAVGWFSNTNSFVKNLSSLVQHGQVLRYGYVMEKTTVTDTYFAGDVVRVPTLPHSAMFKAPYPAVSSITFRTTVKKRIKANPFGFGVSWDGLSPVQAAIAAALGITRVVR